MLSGAGGKHTHIHSVRKEKERQIGLRGEKEREKIEYNCFWL